MTSKTFRSSEKWRANEIGGAGHLVRTETVFESGRVEWHVVGSSEDDGYINKRGVREYGPLDLEAVTAARLGMGWTVVP